MNGLVINNLQEVKRKKHYKLVKFCIDNFNIAFVKKGKIGETIGYACIVDDKTSSTSTSYEYQIYDFDNSSAMFGDQASYQATNFTIKLPKQYNLIKIGNSEYYGYIQIESTKELYVSNLVCYDFSVTLEQEKSTKVVSGITKYYNKLKIKLSDLDDLPGQTIYINFWVDIFKGNSTSKKIKTQFFNVNLYYSSGAPEGD